MSSALAERGLPEWVRVTDRAMRKVRNELLFLQRIERLREAVSDEDRADRRRHLEHVREPIERRAGALAATLTNLQAT